MKDKKIFAIDIAKERIARTQAIDKKFHCFVADACHLSGIIKDNTIDLVISRQVIEHIENQKRLILEIRRILRRSGYLYLTTVFKKRYGWYFYKNKYGKWVLGPTHIRGYQEDSELVPLLEKSGFQIINNFKTIYRFPLTDFFSKD